MGNGYTPSDYDPGYPPPPTPRNYRNFTPPPATPDSFTRSNDQGGRDQHPVDPSNYNRPTQVAEAPPPPQPPARPENINDPTPPADTKPVTPGQFSPVPWHNHPDQGRHPAAVPVTPPTPSIFPPISVLPNPHESPFAGQIQQAAHAYGVPPALLSALLHAESSYNPNATGPMTKYGWRAQGIAQFSPDTARKYNVSPYDPDSAIRGAANYLRDLRTQTGSWKGAVAAYNGAKSLDASGYTTSPAGRSLIAMASYMDGPGAVKLGSLAPPPPQNYRPHSFNGADGYPSFHPDRPISEWGQPPRLTGLPGEIPHEREIPGIMKGLAPMLMIGLAALGGGAGGMGALSFFSGYQNARNKRQEEDAKLLRTRYQDQFKESLAALQLEQTDAAYAMSLPAGSPEQKQALQEIATRYQDPQLQAIIEQGGDPQKLFQLRDNASQDMSKVAKANLDLEKGYADLAIKSLELQEKQEQAPDKKQELQDKIAKAKADRDALAKQEQERPGSTGITAAPATPAPAEAPATGEKSADGAPAAAGPVPETPAPADGAPPAAAPAPGAPAAPSADQPAAQKPTPSNPLGLPPRFGPGGPPKGFTGPEWGGGQGAPAPAPASEAPPQGRQTSAPGGEDQVIPDPNAPRLIPASYVRPVADQQPGMSMREVPKGPSEADIENQENATVRTGRAMLHGDEPPAGMAAGANDAAERVKTYLDGQIASLTTSGLTGQKLIDAVRKVDNRTANDLANLMTNRIGLPSGSQGGGGSVRLTDYRQMLANLAIAGAPPDPTTGDPGWLPDQYEHIQKFKDDSGRVQWTLSRANSMSEAYALVLNNLKRIQEAPDFDPAAFPQTMDALAARAKGDPKFSSLYANIQRFTQEEQALISGSAAVTETERGIQTVLPPMVPGSPEMIREYMVDGLKTAGSRVRGYEHQWKMLHAPGALYGSNPASDAIMASAPYLNAKTGGYDNLPEGITLPPDLASALPTVVPKGWHPDKDYK